jgi:hypothetical protein
MMLTGVVVHGQRQVRQRSVRPVELVLNLEDDGHHEAGGAQGGK